MADLTEEQKRTIRQLRTAGANTKEIAKATGIWHDRVCKFLRAEGFKSLFNPYVREIPADEYVKLHAEVIGLWNDGLSTGMVALKTGKTRGSVWGIVSRARELGIAVRTGKATPEKSLPLWTQGQLIPADEFARREAELLRLFNEERLSVDTIAARLGRTRGSICSALNRARNKGIYVREALRPPAISREEAKMRERHRKATSRALARQERGARPKAKEAAPAAPVIPPEQLYDYAVSILSVRNGECRWVLDRRIEDPLAVMCGRPSVDGTDWCKCHRALVYRPAKKAAVRPNYNIRQSQARRAAA